MNEIGKWRLPTIQELLSIVDYTKCKPATNMEGIKPDYYWSSSPSVSDSSRAWFVTFYYGYGYFNYKSNSNYVRCVRTLEDGSLEWAKEDAPIQMSWKDAMDYAESLNAEPKKTIVLETWIVKSFSNKLYVVEGTYEYLNYMFGDDKVKLIATKEVEI